MTPELRFLLSMVAGSVGVIVGRALVPVFCRWRLSVWNQRLNRARAIWINVPESRTDWLYWEAQVTKAQVRMVKWRKRVRR